MTTDSTTDHIDSTRVLGIPIAHVDYQRTVGWIERWVAEGSSRYIGVCPVHSVVESVWHTEHRRALESADLNTPDGMPIVWAQKLLGFPRASRVYGPTLMLHALERAERKGWRVGFYGGHPERLARLLERLRVRFPSLDIVFAESPPFRALTPGEDASVVTRIHRSAPQLLWVGLGCPKQEAWMHDHASDLRTVMIGVGAAFDFHAGAVRQAPALLQRAGLEWAFRLACEPRRLFWRYATTNPTYLALLARQLFQHWVMRRSFHDRHAPTPASPLAVAPAMAPAADPVAR